jgi:Bacterial SH3 domain
MILSIKIWKQIMRKITLLILMIASAGCVMASFTTPARAQYCEGTVHGIQGRYNKSTGAGFLAMRAAPRTAATQVGELFNGDKVEIFERRRKWYKVATAAGPMVEGWVNARWLRNDCHY